MQMIIDRIEGDFFIVELPDGTMAKVEKAVLAQFSEGDVISIAKDDAATKAAKKAADEALCDLFGRG